jgi:hypothetical protein
MEGNMARDTVLSVRFSPDQIQKLDCLAEAANIKRVHVIKALLAKARLVTVSVGDDDQAGRPTARGPNSESGTDDTGAAL